MHEQDRAIATQDLLPALVHRLAIYQDRLGREGRKERAAVVKTLIADLERQRRVVDSILEGAQAVVMVSVASQRSVSQ